MHTYYCSVEIERVGSTLFFHEVEIWHWARIVILDGIGVEAQELYPACDEAEVGIAKHHFIGLVACTQTVMVAKQHNKWSLQLLQFLTSPLEFLCGTKIGYIPKMHHKVDAVTFLVDVIHLLDEVIEPLVTVADDSEADGILTFYRTFYLLDIRGIHILVAVHMHIVRMHIKYRVTARHGHQAQQSKRNMDDSATKITIMWELFILILFHATKLQTLFELPKEKPKIIFEFPKNTSKYEFLKSKKPTIPINEEQ